MPFNPKDPEYRAKRRAAYARWSAKAKATNSEAWKRKQEGARLRAPRYRQQVRAYVRRLQAEEPERLRAYSRKYRLKKLEAAAGRKKPKQCEVCGGGGPIHFDHCHRSGSFRGWICFSCNAVLGHVHDDTRHLRKLIAYLKRT